MAIDYAKVVREAFEEVGARNPLKKLDDLDKRLLVSFLYIYRAPIRLDKAYKHFEECADIAAEAGELGRRIRSVVLGGQLAQILNFGTIQDLPARLENFSIQLGSFLDKVAGKRGHKSKVAKSRFLITASELVRLKTGKHYDEHLAELLQAVGPRVSLEKLADISGDSIRKKREHLKKTYPLVYAHIVTEVRNLSTRCLSV